MPWWDVLTTVDEIHNYLQFLLPTLVFLSLNFIYKSRSISTIGFGFSSLVLIVIAYFSSGQNFDLWLFIKIAVALFLPLLLWFVAFKTSSKLATVLEYLAIISLFLFFLTQVIFGGCVIHTFQNYAATKYLRLDIWQPVRLFGSQVFNPIFVFILYLVLSLFLGYFLIQKFRQNIRYSETSSGRQA